MHLARGNEKKASWKFQKKYFLGKVIFCLKEKVCQDFARVWGKVRRVFAVVERKVRQDFAVFIV